jgi:hypothetical protein
MVIWRRKKEAWDGFVFLGESRHGKTPLSFALAHLLFMGGVRELKIFDDCFKIDGGRIRQCRAWGNRDPLGEGYYTELAEATNALGHSISEIEPGDHAYTLGKAAAYLLLFADGVSAFKKKRCSRMEFVEKLMPSNPFTWDYPKPGKDAVLQRFRENWMYFIIQRQRKTSKELIDTLANEAFEDSKHLDG